MRYVLFFIFALITTNSFSQTWKEMFKNQGSKYSFHGTRTYKKGDVIYAWIKVEIPENNIESARAENISDRKKYNLPTEGYEKYSYTINQFQINCKTYKLAIASITDYDENGKLLDNTINKELDWHEAIPNSISESVLEFLCKRIK